MFTFARLSATSCRCWRIMPYSAYIDSSGAGLKQRGALGVGCPTRACISCRRALPSTISALPFGPVVRLCEAGGEDGVGAHCGIGHIEPSEGTVATWSHAPFSKPDVRLLSMYLHMQRRTRNATTMSHSSCYGRTRARKRARRATRGSHRRLGVCTAFSFAELGKSRNVIEAASSSYGGNSLLVVPTGWRRREAPEIRCNSHEQSIT
jgi:hypothetical protein